MQLTQDSLSSKQGIYAGIQVVLLVLRLEDQSGAGLITVLTLNNCQAVSNDMCSSIDETDGRIGGNLQELLNPRQNANSAFMDFILTASNKIAIAFVTTFYIL